jgi:hypothetical protein
MGEQPYEIRPGYPSGETLHRFGPLASLKAYRTDTESGRESKDGKGERAVPGKT